MPLNKRLLLFTLPVLAACALLACGLASAQTTQPTLVRLAELEIDPIQIEAYKAALREGMQAAIRTEPGVLPLYAVTLTDQPTHIRLFEQYRDAAAYQAHLKTPHFLKYKSTTQHMVLKLTLLDADPLLLAEKPNLH